MSGVPELSLTVPLICPKRAQVDITNPIRVKHLSNLTFIDIYYRKQCNIINLIRANITNNILYFTVSTINHGINKIIITKNLVVFKLKTKSIINVLKILKIFKPFSIKTSAF